MNRIQLLNKISKQGINRFNKDNYEISTDIDNPDAIMVRSASMKEMEFGSNLKAIARCGAGVNNIPVDECAEKGIVVFNTPGANANGVKELAILALLLASRKVVQGVNWASALTEDVAKSVESGKGQFAGNEIKGKTLGVIGLGAIGGMVANAAVSLGMDVIGFDPYITVEGAWHLSTKINKASSYEEIFEKSDYITLHVPATKETKNMINSGSISIMKQGVKIINLARADLVCAKDLKEALNDGQISAYVTDFPTEETINVPGIITIPHLGASTLESEDNCAVMAADELQDFLENGNISNSVNYPNISLPKTEGKVYVILHKNIPNMISSITKIFSDENINIDNLANRSKGDYACTIVDANCDLNDELISKIASNEGIIRIIKIN